MIGDLGYVECPPHGHPVKGFHIIEGFPERYGTGWDLPVSEGIKAECVVWTRGITKTQAQLLIHFALQGMIVLSAVPSGSERIYP